MADNANTVVPTTSAFLIDLTSWVASQVVCVAIEVPETDGFGNRSAARGWTVYCRETPRSSENRIAKTVATRQPTATRMWSPRSRVKGFITAEAAYPPANPPACA